MRVVYEDTELQLNSRGRKMGRKKEEKNFRVQTERVDVVVS